MHECSLKEKKNVDYLRMAPLPALSDPRLSLPVKRLLRGHDGDLARSVAMDTAKVC